MSILYRLSVVDTLRLADMLDFTLWLLRVFWRHREHESFTFDELKEKLPLLIDSRGLRNSLEWWNTQHDNQWEKRVMLMKRSDYPLNNMDWYTSNHNGTECREFGLLNMALATMVYRGWLKVTSDDGNVATYSVGTFRPNIFNRKIPLPTTRFRGWYNTVIWLAEHIPHIEEILNDPQNSEMIDSGCWRDFV